MAKGAADLDVFLKPGQGKAVAPEALTTQDSAPPPPEPVVQAAPPVPAPAPSTNMAKIASLDEVPVDQTDVLRPAQTTAEERKPLSVRIKADISYGLKAMVFATGKSAQAIADEALEEHLTKWHPNWRKVVFGKQ